MPDGVAGATDLTLLDDGSPAAWSVAYTADGGADVSGKLPRNLSGEIIASSMGLDDVQGDPFVALTGEDAPDEALSALSIASEYLPETETLSYTTSADGVTLDMALSPGVDIDLVAADLAARLDGDVSFSIAALDELPEHRATMKRERFQFGNWLPILSFAPVGPICLDQSTAALENNAVNFISGSAQLDGKSIRAINALSAIAQRCVDEGGLSLEVGGHTDNTGSEISNQLLSENRAESVRNAMIARGVDADKITAVGYGQATPVADNDTIEGRAENRRTEITWSQ